MKLPVYNLKVKGEDGNKVDRKAIDVESLNDWIENQIAANNPLLLEPEVIQGKTVDEIKGIISWNLVLELAEELKRMLGYIEDEPKKSEKVPVNEAETKDTKDSDDEVSVEKDEDSEDIVVM